MSYYLDAAFIVSSLVTDEVAGSRCRDWLREHARDELAISHWVTTEVSSALSIKVRRRDFTSTQRDEVLVSWRAMSASSLERLDVDQADFVTAARFADRHDLSLRAGDALHLAVAFAHGCTLVTLDRVMAEAARQCGVPVAEVGG